VPINMAVFNWGGTPLASFTAPRSAWYLLELDCPISTNFRAEPDKHSDRVERHWRLTGAPPAGYAVDGSGVLTFERALALQPGGWAQSGVLPLPARCMMLLWLERNETLYSSHPLTNTLIQQMAEAPDPCGPGLAWYWVTT